jgi:2-keto-4-pentenoate hydratase
MTMTLDGHEVSAGSGQACLGDPLHALAWLANTARDLGSPLLAGQIILSGALGPMAPVTGGSKVIATISGLGTVTAQFH